MPDHSAHTAAPSDRSTGESEAAGDEATSDGAATDATASGGAATDGGAERTGGLDASRRDVMRMAAAGAAVGTGFASNLVGSAVAVGIDTPWLERDGNLLRDPEGDQVILRGVNIADPARLARTWRGKGPMDVYDKATNTADSNDGGWHNRILRVPTQPQDISGANNDLQHAHQDDWGPLLPGQFDESDLETFFSDYVDPIVDQAEDEGVYVMVDYHRHFPIFHQPQHEDDVGQYQCGSETFENDLGFCGERGVLWHSEDQASQLDGYTEEYAAELDQELQLYWNFVAPRYNDRSHVVYDVYNEPTGPYAGDWGSPTSLPHDGSDEGGEDAPYDDPANQDYWDMWVERAQPWIDTVRTHAPDNLLTIGSPRWSQLTYWAPTNEFQGENICYTGHVYTHDGMRPLADSFGSAAEEVPIFFSEFGWAIDGGKDGFNFLDGTTTGAPEGYSFAYGDDFATFIEDFPVHPICWNFDHTWEPAFFVHDESQDGTWVIHDYEDRPGQWWQEFLYEHRNDDLPSGGGGSDDTTAPTIPSNLGVTDETSSSITVSWDASTDSGGSGLDHYDVLVDGQLDQEVSAGTTSATITGLASDTSYQIAVSATDGAGNTSGTTSVTASTDAGGSEDTTAPTTPSNLSATGTTSSSVDVDWDASSDSGGSGLDHYVVTVDGSQDQSVPAGTTSATVSGLSADTSYQIGVSAVDGAGNESSTTTVSATTDADDGGTGDALLINDYDGSPAWSNNQNDLGQWCGAGSFQNDDGEVVSGALELVYDDGGWFQEQVNQDVSDYSTLVFEVSGAIGGEEDEVLFDMGGVRTMLSNVTSDSIGTSTSEVSVDLVSAGVDRTASSLSVRLNFWQGGSSTLSIDEIRLE